MEEILANEKDSFLRKPKNQKCLLPFERKERNILVKRLSETSPKYGENPEERPLKELLDYGVINIDKPKTPKTTLVLLKIW